MLWIAQAGYIYHLFSPEATLSNAAADVGPHFIVFNLLQFGTVMLWVRSHFFLAEMLIVFNLFNLLTLYLRHPTKPRFIHIGAVSGPLAFVIMALFWDGAVMVGARNLGARIVANVFIWTILFVGEAFILLNKDYTMGLALSFLTAGESPNEQVLSLDKAIAVIDSQDDALPHSLSFGVHAVRADLWILGLGVGQFFTKIFALQWIFAFTIMAVLFLSTLAVSFPQIMGGKTGVDAGKGSGAVGEDAERQPLLDDE